MHLLDLTDLTDAERPTVTIACEEVTVRPSEIHVRGIRAIYAAVVQRDYSAHLRAEFRAAALDAVVSQREAVFSADWQLEDTRRVDDSAFATWPER